MNCFEEGSYEAHPISKEINDYTYIIKDLLDPYKIWATFKIIIANKNELFQ